MDHESDPRLTGSLSPKPAESRCWFRCKVQDCGNEPVPASLADVAALYLPLILDLATQLITEIVESWRELGPGSAVGASKPPSRVGPIADGDQASDNASNVLNPVEGGFFKMYSKRKRVSPWLCINLHWQIMEWIGRYYWPTPFAFNITYIWGRSLSTKESICHSSIVGHRGLFSIAET